MSEDHVKQDVKTLGASSALRKVLDDLQTAGHIDDLVDGYRLCIATACAFQRTPDPDRSSYKGHRTMFAPNTLDTSDQSIRTAIAEIYPDASATPYRAAEDLAEQGAEILQGLMDRDHLSFTGLLKQVEQANVGDDD